MALVTRNSTKAGYYDSAAGKVRPGSRMMLGINGNNLSIFNDEIQWIDLMRRNSDQYIVLGGTPPRDGNGWYDCSLAGNSVTYWFIQQTTGYEVSGNIVVRWAGTATPANTWSGAVVDDSVDHEITYGPITGTGLKGITIAAGTGTCNALIVMQEQYTDDYDAGEIFSPEFITTWSGIDVYRALDQMNTSDSDVRDYTDYTRYADTKTGGATLIRMND